MAFALLSRLHRRPALTVAIATAVVSMTGLTAWAIVTNLTLVDALHDPQAEHADQGKLVALVASGQAHEAFEEAFELGDELFATQFNALDGVGADCGHGQRFTRVPRADVPEWMNQTPSRETGPNAETCVACHSSPFEDGASGAAGNVHRDPTYSGSLGSFIQRNTPHLFGLGGTQRLAEEMTAELQREVSRVKHQACSTGQPVTAVLDAKGVKFGSITATPSGTPCDAVLDTSAVEGIAADLVVRPFQWKGSVAFIRDFNRGAAHNELGMQGVELTGADVDGDGDGVANELTIGDLTSLAVYNAAQPRPTTKQELASLGLIPPLAPGESAAIDAGRATFSSIACASCHVPSLTVMDPIFHEPSLSPAYRDATFPSGVDPVSQGVSPNLAITFDITQDQPDNQIRDASGSVTFHLGSFKTDTLGHAIVEVFGDLKRHEMGSGLAESIDEVGTGASVFLTRNLWGVGSTAPYLHDGRA
ncbi:MAG TPA: di-heme oxidoredictase family protein, partial [Planctomycetota bacterium]|nr:di-heme oxidoredictase family protein [Planctomycetota bacterium]